MQKVYQYIKRLLIFFLCAFLFILSPKYIPAYFSIPLLLLAFSIVHSRITGEKPPHLFAFYRTETYFKKGGLRDLLRIFVTLFGFTYDTIIWTIWGVYLVFLLFVDLLDLIKTIFYWIIHALLWFLRQYVPFFIFIYRIAIHYLIRWPWWLYQIAFHNMRYAYNKNCYKVAIRGTIQAVFIIFFFYYLEILLFDKPGLSITFLGIIIAMLPLTWSFGEIANIRTRKLENEAYSEIKPTFLNGIESVRSILFYIFLFVVLILAQLGLNLMGWIPESGILIAGFLFNINSLISLVLLFIGILIVLGIMIIPSYRLFVAFLETRISDTIDLLKVIRNKFLQYMTVIVPSAVMSFIVIVIPLFVAILVGILTYSLKNAVTDIKINNLRTEQAKTANADTSYIINKQIEQLQYLHQFPLRLFQEMEHRKSITNELAFAQDDFRSMKEELLKDSEALKVKIDKIQQEIYSRLNTNPTDITTPGLTEEKTQLEKDLSDLKQTKQMQITRLKTDIDFLMQRRSQIPFLLFFGGLWLVIFGSLVFAFMVSYFGNIFHQVYIFRNNNDPSEWQQAISDIHSKDYKQPLLGGTLFVATLLLIYLLITNTNITNAVIIFLSSLLT